MYRQCDWTAKIIFCIKVLKFMIHYANNWYLQTWKTLSCPHILPLPPFSLPPCIACPCQQRPAGTISSFSARGSVSLPSVYWCRTTLFMCLHLGLTVCKEGRGRRVGACACMCACMRVCVRERVSYICVYINLSGCSNIPFSVSSIFENIPLLPLLIAFQIRARQWEASKRVS